MTSADTLRRAATLMRERAKAANPSPWVIAEHHVFGQPVGAAGSPSSVANTGWGDRSMSTPNAEHIASWHPAVALAVADWLDDLAGAWEQQAQQFAPGGPFAAIGTWVAPEHHKALVVARAYLGEDA